MADGKVLSGDDFNPPPAAVWNNMVDAGTAWANSRFSNSTPNPIRPRETDIIKVKNTSGAARRLGEILRISGKAIETVTDENKWLLGVEPTDDGYFGILKEPAVSNGLASLQVSGCCMALVDITDEAHTRATSAAGDYVLQSGDEGPIEILYAASGTGEKTCVVRFAGSGAAGGGGTSTDPCPCNCVDQGDAIVNEIETTLRFTIKMTKAEVFNQEFGSITLPAGDYMVTLDTMTDIWSLDVGDDLTAKYTSGADATADTTMDGELTMGFDDDGIPYVKLCVDGEVPEEE